MEWVTHQWAEGLAANTSQARPSKTEDDSLVLPINIQTATFRVRKRQLFTLMGFKDVSGRLACFLKTGLY